MTLADDKLALASDAAALRQQVDGYEELIAELKSTLVNQETLARAESMASTAAAQLASAQQRNAELARRCAVEEASNAALAAQLAEVEAAAAAATERNHDLLEATREASVQRHTLESRRCGRRTTCSSFGTSCTATARHDGRAPPRVAVNLPVNLPGPSAPASVASLAACSAHRPMPRPRWPRRPMRLL